VETDVKHLLTRVAELDASLQQTVSEFREALEKHRDHHRDEAREASNTRWRWISALLAVAAVLGPILTYCLPKVF
jgi:cyclopropane fatty-acyl-phospholipid synthase-like methyltransferase